MLRITKRPGSFSGYCNGRPVAYGITRKRWYYADGDSISLSDLPWIEEPVKVEEMLDLVILKPHSVAGVWELLKQCSGQLKLDGAYYDLVAAIDDGKRLARACNVDFLVCNEDGSFSLHSLKTV